MAAAAHCRYAYVVRDGFPAAPDPGYAPAPLLPAYPPLRPGWSARRGLRGWRQSLDGGPPTPHRGRQVGAAAYGLTAALTRRFSANTCRVRSSQSLRREA